MDPRSGYAEIFPTRVHKFEFDKKLLETIPESSLKVQQIDEIISTWQSNSKTSFVDVSKDLKFKKVNDEVLRLSSLVCPTHERIGEWKIVGAWMNIQAPGQVGFDFHAHCDSFMSCTLYLKGKGMSLGFRDEARQANTSKSNEVSNYDIQVSHTWWDDIWLPVESGDLLVFPSYQLHKPNPNEADEERISIAYNLMPCRKQEAKRLPWSMELEL